MLHTTDGFHVSLPCGLWRTIWQLETPVVAPAPGANMPLSPSSVANAERMEKLSRTIRDSVSFFFFERYCSHYPLGCRWLIFFLFYVFFLWWFDCEVLTLTLCFTKFPSSDRFWRCSRRFFFGCRSYSAPKMTGEQRREARWDSRHHILFAKDRFCWLSGMNKGYVV